MTKEETEYKRLYWVLNFIFGVIKEKELQEKLFSWIYNDFLKYKKNKEIKNRKNNIDIVLALFIFSTKSIIIFIITRTIVVNGHKISFFIFFMLYNTSITFIIFTIL